MDTSDVSHTSRTQTNTTESGRWLDKLLEDRYRELFGEEHLYEDLSELRTEKINTLNATSIPVNIQYERAMAAYRRELEAGITRHQVGSAFSFPPTIQCVKAPDSEEGLELNIDPAEVNEIMGDPNNIVVTREAKPQVSNRQRKKEEWKNRRSMVRRKVKNNQ